MLILDPLCDGMLATLAVEETCFMEAQHGKDDRCTQLESREVRAFKERTTDRQLRLIRKLQETTYSLGDTCMSGAVPSCAYLIDVLKDSVVKSITLQSLILSHTVSLALRTPRGPVL